MTSPLSPPAFPPAAPPEASFVEWSLIHIVPFAVIASLLALIVFQKVALVRAGEPLF